MDKFAIKSLVNIYNATTNVKLLPNFPYCSKCCFLFTIYLLTYLLTYSMEQGPS